MKLLVLCFLGVIGTTVGSIVFEGTVQQVCQTGFFIALAASVVLLLLGHFN